MRGPGPAQQASHFASGEHGKAGAGGVGPWDLNGPRGTLAAFRALRFGASGV